MNRDVDDEDFVPVTGRAASPDACGPDSSSWGGFKAESELDLHLFRLLKLHPEIPIPFRIEDLAKLGDAAKRTLVQDINDRLGIRPLSLSCAGTLRRTILQDLGDRFAARPVTNGRPPALSASPNETTRDDGPA